MTIPNTMIYMGSYEYIKKALTDHLEKDKTDTFLVPGIAGGIGRGISVTVASPLELARTLQMGRAALSGSHNSNESVLSILRSVYKTRGIGGLYKGWSPTLLRDCPFSAIYWISFEKTRPFFANKIDGYYETHCEEDYSAICESNSIMGQSNDILPTFLAAASAGLVSGLLTQPFDVIKTLQQLEMDSTRSIKPQSTSATSPNHPTGVSEASTEICKPQLKKSITLKNLWREGGLRFLYRGLSMRMASVLPGSAIFVTVYETVKKLDLT